MAELWQSYGTWVLYGLGFVVFFWLHGFMHGGHGGHAGHGGTRGGSQGGAHGAHTAPDGPQTRQIADGSPGGAVADATSRGDQAPGKSAHTHGRGCC